jgi:DNA adenine methylase
LKPFLKWVGGKTKNLSLLTDKFPQSITQYIEPFVGGGSVLFRVIELIANGKIKVSGRVIASDINQSLINTYVQVQQNPEELIEYTTQLISQYKETPITGVINRKSKTLLEAQTSRESYYYWIRNRFNHLNSFDSIEAASLFIFLNKTCFRGLYREGPNGFNVPYGNYKSPTIIDSDHILSISIAIKNVVFICDDYTNVLVQANPNDLVYFDPPYVPEITSSFVKYVEKGFNDNDHDTLFILCKELRIKGVTVVLSNSDTTKVKDVFADSNEWTVSIIECRRAINSKKPNSKTNEVLIVSN